MSEHWVAAVDYGAEAFHHEKVFGLKVNDTGSDEARAFAAGLYAALPHLRRMIVAELRGEAEREAEALLMKDEPDWTIVDEADRYAAASQAAHWLAAQEADR